MVEVEHSHEAGGGHGHQHVEAGGEHGHHSHKHDTPPPADDSHGGEQDGEHHPHSHVVSLGADMPFALANFPMNQAIGSAYIACLLPDPDRCPDGPCFPLMKPPQLG